MDLVSNGMPIPTNTKVSFFFVLLPSSPSHLTSALAGDWKNSERHGKGLMYIAENNSYYDCPWEHGQACSAI